MFFKGSRLHYARKFKGLTLEELVQMLENKHAIKSNKGMISRWENGKAVPRDESIRALADILEVETDYLLGRNCFEYEIKEHRHKNKLSIKELSEISGVEESLISLIECEIDYPSKDELQKLGKAFGFEDFHSYLLENGMPVYAEDVGITKKIDKSYLKDYFKDLKSVEDAVEWLNMMWAKENENYKLVIEKNGEEKPIYLDELLTNSTKVYFKENELTNEEREKLYAILDIVYKK